MILYSRESKMSDIWHNADITPYPLKSFVIKTKNGNIYTGIITKPEEWNPLILPEFYSIGDIDNADTILKYAYIDDLLACEQELDRTRKALDVAIAFIKELDDTMCGVKEQLHTYNGKTLNAGIGFCWATPDEIHNTLKQINEIKGGKDEL